MALSLSLSAHPPLTLRSMAENMRYNVEVVGVAGMPRLDPDIRSLVSYLGSSACDFTGSYACTCVRARIEREREKEGLREGGREGGRERERCIQKQKCIYARMHACIRIATEAKAYRLHVSLQGHALAHSPV